MHKDMLYAKANS